MPHDHTEFVVGERIPGTKYVLCGVLGKGGMGVVYEVVKEPGIRGAMKVMYPSMVTRPDCVARFFDEVRLLAKLRHKNIVAVHDFDRLENGTPFLVMERLEGETLRSTLRKSARSAQGFPARGAYEVTRQTCEGLYRAHTQSSPVVHRDIKPENLFLNQLSGSDEVDVKVLDFGVAALVDSGKARGQFGTPKYMAPEQFRGETATPRSDLYAVALVLYEMLTGRRPWEAERDGDVYNAHLFVQPAPPSHFAPWVPKSVDALMASALARDPAERPHSVFAFASQLYELQWVDDGHSRAADVNTTAPTLTTLVSEFGEERRELGGSGGAHDTFRGMTPPPIEGASLEVISYEDAALRPETTHVASPSFSPETAAPATAEPTKIPASGPTVDPRATTREQLPLTRRVPKHDTQPLSSPSPPVGSEEAYAKESARGPVRAGVPSPVPPPIAPARASPSGRPSSSARPAATPLAGVVGSIPSGAPRRGANGQGQWVLPIGVFLAIVSIGTSISMVVTQAPRSGTAAFVPRPDGTPPRDVRAVPASAAALETAATRPLPTGPSGGPLETDASAAISEAPHSPARLP
jgi:eukaryotic-like serine/threonine-protein kinase